jgi:chemotaxis regulatin CheY-phosphate phosphatase CheZ
MAAENRDDVQWVEEAKAAAASCEAACRDLAEGRPEAASAFEELRDRLQGSVVEPLERLLACYRATEQEIVAMIAHQSFQDLAGQTLQKVILLLERLQFQLVELLRRYAGARGAAPAPATMPEAGPEPEPAPKQSQEDVDRLLSELGF